jgi:hypothetical protein
MLLGPKHKHNLYRAPVPRLPINWLKTFSLPVKWPTDRQPIEISQSAEQQMLNKFVSTELVNKQFLLRDHNKR